MLVFYLVNQGRGSKMNEDLQEFARDQLKEGLAQCTEDQQLLFKRMYSHKNLEASIDEAVDNMPDEKLDRAMGQLKATLEKFHS